MESESPLGVVPLDGRGTLPFTLVHGESLVAVASWALSTADIELFDFDVPLAEIAASGRMLVLHDPLCPLTPVGFLERAVALATSSGAIVVGVRPVTDTVKEYDGQALGRTHDRADLVVVTSPVVLPPAVMTTLESLEPDFAALVEDLRTRFPVTFLEAPALGRRIVSADDLTLLEALSG